ncbi:MAG: tetratricopeptide repeat protein, partial [Candidatus Acidiferrales bacterium]
MFLRLRRKRNSEARSILRRDLRSSRVFALSVLSLFVLVVATPSFARRQAHAQAHADQAATLIEQGRAEAAAGKFPDAIASYQEALHLAPHNLQAEIAVVQAYRGVHNFDEAKKILDEAHREHPRSAAPLAVYGDLDIQLQTYEAAIAHLNAALALDPADVDARNRLAVAYKAKGDAPSALAQLAKILARDPKNALAHYTRADIYADHNQDALALVDAEKVVELQPENPLGRALLAKILVRPPEKPAPGEIKERCAKAVNALE